MKKLALLAAVATLSFSAPSFADEMAKCSEESLMKMEMGLKAMTDPAMKDKMEMGMKELDMAMKADKDGMAKDCAMHLDAAMKATQG